MSNKQVRGEIKRKLKGSPNDAMWGTVLGVVFDNTKLTNPRAKSDGALR